jgi:hypothetical protein
VSAWWARCFLLVLALPLAGCGSMLRAFGGGMTPALAASGVPAAAEILELWDTGWTINDSPVIGMKVRVLPDEGPPYEAVIEKTTISRLAVSQFQPGNVIPVRFDAHDPRVVAVDPDPPQHAAPSGGNAYRNAYAAVRHADLRTLPPPADPEVFLGTADRSADAQALVEYGFALLGRAGVHGGEDLSQAVAQGKEVGAALVVLYGSYAEQPEVLPYRRRPRAAGTQVPAPWGEALFPLLGPDDRLAAYWVKTPPGILGVVVRPLDASETTRFGHGAFVDAVTNGSPAAEARIAEGDVLVAIEGEPLADAFALAPRLRAFAGKPVRIDLIRESGALSVVARLKGLE